MVVMRILVRRIYLSVVFFRVRMCRVYIPFSRMVDAVIRFYPYIEYSRRYMYQTTPTEPNLAQVVTAPDDEQYAKGKLLMGSVHGQWTLDDEI